MKSNPDVCATGKRHRISDENSEKKSKKSKLRVYRSSDSK